MRHPLLHVVLASLALAGCSGGESSTKRDSGPAMTDAQYSAKAVSDMHAALLSEIQAMEAAGVALRDAAPTPADRGWDAQLDASAIASMREDWVTARSAYEHVEGALAPLFPNVDTALDARYDDFMTALATDGGDEDLFDGHGVTGMHAIERILYSNVTPQRVVDFEASLPGYVPAAFPATAAEAKELHDGLCAQFVADAKNLEEQWTPANIDVAISFAGVISLVTEQREKVVKAASDEEESRYSQRTMADLRDNLEGTRTIYGIFRPWILSKKNAGDPAKDGPSIDARIEAGFDALDAAYAAVDGDAIPEPPPTWSAEAPSTDDLATPFGKLYSAVVAAVDPADEGSVVAQMNAAAERLGFPTFGGHP